jgi:phage-related protein
MPHSRPMPDIGERCHELRIVDVDATWRIIYRSSHRRSVRSVKTSKEGGIVGTKRHLHGRR